MYSTVETLIKVLRNYHQLKVLFTFVERIYSAVFNSLSASFLLNIFLSFEVGIAHAIANFK